MELLPIRIEVRAWGVTAGRCRKSSHMAVGLLELELFGLVDPIRAESWVLRKREGGRRRR